MFSAFKKLTTKQENGGNTRSVSPGNVQCMSTNLQRKFAKGCNYNMKIVIRGDKNTGKSCLLARLQGKPFIEEYSATEEIQVASINWSYKNTEDVVKVEVWDVVDVAKKRKKLTGLKMSGDQEEFETGLDASFIDVYKGCHGAILVFDICKPWTWDYVKREVEQVNSSIPILILANFTDASHHRQVTRLQVADFVENIAREGSEPAEVRWGETSLRNGFGLKFLHKFFNLPFLTLQRQSLLQQLQLNERDIRATQEELDLYMESEEGDYHQFSDRLNTRRREAAEQVAPAPSASIVVGQPSNSIDPSSKQFTTSQMSFSNKSASKQTDSPAPTSASTEQTAAANSSPTKLDVDNFVPDDGGFDNFLDDTDSARSKPSLAVDDNLDSSDDDEGFNPMVAKIADDDSDVEVDTYEPSIPKVQDFSEDSDSEPAASKIETNKNDVNLDTFLNGGQDDVAISHKDYEEL